MGGRSVAVVLVVSLFAASSFARADETLIEPLPAAPTQVRSSQDVVVFKLRFVPKDGAEVHGVTAISITSGDASRPELLDGALTAELDAKAAALMFTLHTDKLEATNYDVGVSIAGDVTSPDGKKTHATQPITVKLNVLSPKLR